MNLYKFYVSLGRSGSLDGLFVSTKEEVDNTIGKEASFGEILGKHSDVNIIIEEGYIEKQDLTERFILEGTNLLGRTWSGINPLGYINGTCEICDYTGTPEEVDISFRENLNKKTCYECWVENK